MGRGLSLGLDWLNIRHMVIVVMGMKGCCYLDCFEKL